MKNLLICIVFVAFSCLSLCPALAEPALERAVELYQAGKAEQSLQAVQDYLSAWPNEPRGLFLKGLALERLGREAEAMKVYQGLINSHPEFPEPYNNLAGLLAGQGRFEEAKETLEQALQTHPSYAAAHQNLSRIYSAMASQAYRRVLGAEEEHLRVSLDPLEDLSRPGSSSLLAEASASRPVVAAVQPDVTSPEPARPTPPSAPLISTDEPGATPPVSEALVEPSPLVAESVSAEQTADDPVVTPQQEITEPREPWEPDLHQQMKKRLHAWAKAWAGQDVQEYLSFYSSSFVPERGLSFQAWQEQRKVRVAAPPFINISLYEISVSELDQDVVQVHFSQHYRSNVINDRVRKELLFQKENGEWRITRERLLPR